MEGVRLIDFKNSVFSTCLASQYGGVLFGNTIRQVMQLLGDVLMSLSFSGAMFQ